MGHNNKRREAFQCCLLKEKADTAADLLYYFNTNKKQ